MAEAERFRDRVVVVTGGGTGIGRAAAERFVIEGARVVVTGRRPEPLAEVARSREQVVAVAADVSREDDAARIVEAALERWGRLDVVVNNAGAFALRPLEAVTAELAADIFATNVIGPTLLVREALPYLAEAQGAVVNVSSTFGHKPAAGIGHYAASKAALEHLTRCWALELAPRGIRVNAVAPGPTESAILARSGLPSEAVDAIKREEVARIPLGRRGTPAEVAAWIVAMASPDAAWITGQILAVDGGLVVT